MKSKEKKMERLEDAILLIVKMEKEDKSQGKWVTSRN